MKLLNFTEACWKDFKFWDDLFLKIWGNVQIFIIKSKGCAHFDVEVLK